MTRRIAQLVLPVLLVGGLLAWSATGTTESYTRIDLGPGTGNAVNGSGVVAGVVYAPDGARATLWSPTTQAATDLGIDFSMANGINDEGVVVGVFWSGSADRAFRWKDGVMTDLGTLPGFPHSVATGVNAGGQIVGYCYDDAIVCPGTGWYLSRAFLWENGSMIDLGTLGGSCSWAAAINDAGTVVGTSDIGDAYVYQRAFAWDAAGGMRDLGATEGNDSSAASGIDASGHVVGWSYPMFAAWDEYGEIYYWYPGPGSATLFVGGTAVALGGPDTYAYGVRDATAGHGVQVVGYFVDYACGYSAAAALWEYDAAGQVTAYDLNDLLDASFAGDVFSASSISAEGRIVASGAGITDGPAHVYSLAPSTLPPVPQPPRAPANFTAVASSERVSLSWSAACGADSYVVQRGTSPGGPYQTIATGLTQTTVADTSAPLGSTYYYVVAGVRGGTVGSPSAEAAAAPLPYAPTNLTAKAGKGSRKDQVELRWTASVSMGIAHYRVYRRTSSGNMLVGTFGPVTGCTVSGLARRTTYSFLVTAVHAGGQESFASNVASIKTQ